MSLGVLCICSPFKNGSRDCSRDVHYVVFVQAAVEVFFILSTFTKEVRAHFTKLKQDRNVYRRKCICVLNSEVTTF